MKMDPRPSSSTSLLWAHQFKRENGHLLSRIQHLESSKEQHDARLKSAEAAARSNTNNDISTLAEQVRAIDGRAIDERVAKMEREVTAKLDDVQADSEATVLKLAEMEKNDEIAKEEKRQAFLKEKALLKRVAEVEESLKKYEASLKQVGRRVDEGSIPTIQAQLQRMSEQAKKEGAEVKVMEDSIRVLETAQTELGKANDRLAAEVQKLADRSLSKSAAASTPAAPTAVSGRKTASKRKQPEPDPEQEEDHETPPTKKSKKKSHKWAGGGADKDIINQAADFKVSERRVSTPSKHTAKPPPPKPRAVPKPSPKPVAKPAPKAVSKKPVTKRAPPKGTARPVKQSQRQRQPQVREEDANKPIIRAGKGWYEVPASPSSNDLELEDEDEQPTQRKRGRPRKSEASEPPSKYRAMQKRQSEANDQGIFRSPSTSPRPDAGQRRETKDALLDACRSQPKDSTEDQQPPPAKRRRIIQQTDNGTFLEQMKLYAQIG